MLSFYTKKKYFLFLIVLIALPVFSQSIAVNEVMSSNLTTILDEDQSPSDWIELYNYGNETVNLNGFGLTDDPALPYKWSFPNIILNPNSYLLVWASEKNRTALNQPLHTNFKISSSGEEIILTNILGEIVSQAPTMALPSNVSLGRQPNGTGPWLFFYTPTPNAPNTNLGLTELLVPPTFSQNSGFYTVGFNLTLSHPNPAAIIIYTLDGSEPNINNLSGTTFQYKNTYPILIGASPGPLLNESYKSFQYSNPIIISDQSAMPNKLSIKNTRQDILYEPLVPVRKGTVLKAKSYVNGIPSKTVSANYFIWSGGNPYTIPVVALQTQENNLFDYNLGTYTAGIDFDTWRANNPDNSQFFRPEWCNYARKSSIWEYPMNVELFNNNISVFNQQAGYRIHGNNSRAYIIKSLRLYADATYDEKDYFQSNLFSIPIFDAPNPTNDKFKRILLRGDGSGGSVPYDVVFNRIMQPLYNGVTRIQPVIHFLNGEYWGISALRDRLDKYHYAYNFNLDKNNIAQVGCGGTNCELEEGVEADYLDYIDMQTFIISNNMANETFYLQAANRLDITSFIDHMVLQIYSGTNGYERKFWKVRTVENNGYGDGKWRTSIQDFDPALNSSQDWLQHWSTIIDSPTEEMFTKLLANPGFKTRFINRFADMLNSAFLPTYFTDVVNNTFNEIAPYLVENSNRTTALNFYTPENKQNLLSWGIDHPLVQRNSIKTRFGITDTVTIVANVSNNEAGTVKINTIDISNITPGIAANPYPWTGIYFKNIPITVKASAKQGFTFSHWSGDVVSSNEEITFTPDGNKQIQANFVANGVALDLIYYWFINSSLPNNLPLESINSTYSNTNLTASLQFTSCLVGYPFTSTDVNWRKASMERRNAPTNFNYFLSGNGNLPYDSNSMKGIQIKQPFKDGILENTLRLVLPTIDLQNLKISFAVETDGAAAALLFDYWNGTSWINTGITNPTVTIGVGYAVVQVDLSQVTEANNKAAFQFRIRFSGDNLFLSEGKKVQFNNFAVEGQVLLSKSNVASPLLLTASPNPAQTSVQIQSTEQILLLELYNLYGQTVRQLKPNATSISINIENLPVGIYVLKAKTENQKEKIIKIIKN